MQDISIVVPVFNVKKYLHRCIDSLINQTFKNIEIILVDDGSTDGSGQICDDYEKIDHRISVIHKENGGLSSARLAGYKKATGKYIAFVDSDDYVDINMYEVLHRLILEHDSDICMCSYYTVRNEEVKKISLPIKTGLYNDKKAIQEIIMKMAGRKSWDDEDYLTGFMWLKLYRRSLIQVDWFVSEREYFAEDVIFNLQAFSAANSINVLNECFYYYIFHPSSLSNTYRANRWEMLYRLNSYCRHFFENRRLIENVKQRLDTALVGAVLGSIDNEASVHNHKSTSEKLQEIKGIISTPGVREAVSEQNHDQNTRRKIYYFLIRNGFSRMLLWFSSIRMKRLNQ